MYDMEVLLFCHETRWIAGEAILPVSSVSFVYSISRTLDSQRFTVRPAHEPLARGWEKLHLSQLDDLHVSIICLALAICDYRLFAYGGQLIFMLEACRQGSAHHRKSGRSLSLEPQDG
jgi:hypothetical protein